MIGKTFPYKFLTCSIVTLNSSDLQDKYAAVTLKVVFKKFELQMNFQSYLLILTRITYNISFG